MTMRSATTLVLAVLLTSGISCRKRDCHSPTAPCGEANSLAGTWSGTSTYINAPFTMTLRQEGVAVSGQYRDQKDAGAVSGSVTGSAVTLDVNFGDTGIRLTGTFTSSNRVSGDILVPALGGRVFTFEMVR